MSILLSLAAALFSALNNVSAKYILQTRLPREYIASMTFLSVTIIMGLFSSWYFYFEFTLQAAVLALGVGLLDTLANYLYFTALAGGEVGQVSVYFSLSPIWTILLQIVCGRLDGWLIIPAAIVMTLSTAFLNLQSGRLPTGVWEITDKKNSFIAISSGFFFGVSAFVLKELFRTGATNPPTVFLVRCLIIFLGLTILWRPKLWQVTGKDWGIVSGRGLMVIGKWLCLLYAISGGNVIGAVAVNNSAPVFVLIFSALTLREKITPSKLIACLLVVGGITFIQMVV